MKDLIAALIKAQYEIKGAYKDSTNPHFKSTYADYTSVWNAVREPLLKNGLCITHIMCDRVLVTKLMHESGDFLESKYPILVKDETNPQHFKAAITYAKRANLEGLTGCPSTDDDDGNTAAGLNKSVEASRPVAEAPKVIFDRNHPEHKVLLNQAIKRADAALKINEKLKEFQAYLDKNPPLTTQQTVLDAWLKSFLSKN